MRHGVSFPNFSTNHGNCANIKRRDNEREILVTDKLFIIIILDKIINSTNRSYTVDVIKYIEKLKLLLLKIQFDDTRVYILL